MGGRRGWARAGGLAALAVLVAGCSFGPGPSLFSQPRTPHPTYKVGGPYTIGGVTYYPRVDYAYDRIGVASWYGEQFQGKYTANGEVFDLNGITAAHTTLPLPSIVEVVNLQNNRALHIRVNDRGPFVDGRIIDLSRRAAQLLGFARNGTTTVRVRVLKDESLRAAALAQRGIIDNGAGAYTAVAAAPVRPAPAAVAEAVSPPDRISDAPTETGLPIARAEPASDQAAPRDTAAWDAAGGAPVYQAVAATAAATALVRPRQFFVRDPVYHVQAGPVATRDEADRLRARLIANGYRDARIVID